MGRVIGFSELPDYLAHLESSVLEKTRATILDTNVLISSNYDPRDAHDEVIRTLDLLADRNYRLLATVNTKAEYLEFQRRVFLTETLMDLTDEFSKVVLPSSARAKIATLKGTITTAARTDRDRDPVFNDIHLKKIKKEFSAGSHSGRIGWLKLCNAYLGGRLQQAADWLEECGVEYVSQHEPSQAPLFHSRIDWPEAIGISEKTGASFSDSMILNAFRCSHCPFIVSMDFDVGYAVLADPMMKDAVMPDRMVAEYRHYHFGV
jgi:hypothetical protein